jgi:hypothetical protein
MITDVVHDTPTYPIDHAARVQLPQLVDEDEER